MQDGIYLNDSWTPDISGLAYEHLLKEVLTMVMQSQPPFAAAVYGGWGSGKTSLLRACMNHLGGELLTLSKTEALIEHATEATREVQAYWAKVKVPAEVKRRIRTVWFNPWQHQTESHPMIALLHEIRDQFSFRLKTAQKLKKTSYLALKNGLRLLDDLTASATKMLSGHAIKLGVDKIDKDGRAYEAEHFQTKLNSQRFQMHFETAVAHLVSDGMKAKEDARLVIFIDDLDRCEKGRVLHLLEAIKLYLSTHQCVFVFGLDPDHTERALEREGLTHMEARHYLHKLFQATIHLPRSRNFPTFILGLLQTLNKDGTFAPEDIDQIHADLLAEILEANPRRVKNFLNQLFFHGRLMRKRDGACPKLEPMIYLCGLRFHFPEIFRFLEEDLMGLGTIINAFNTPNQEDAEGGQFRFVQYYAHLPQYETRRYDAEGKRDMPLLVSRHYTDANALFVVLERFKKKFSDWALAQTEQLDALEGYLKP